MRCLRGMPGKRGGGKSAAAVTNAFLPGESGTGARGTRQLLQDIATAHGIPAMETVRAEALATLATAPQNGLNPVRVVGADTPAVTPVHLSFAAFDEQQNELALPGLCLSGEAQAQVRSRLATIKGALLGITTTAVKQGTGSKTRGTGETRTVQKDTGEGEGANPDLVEDFQDILAIIAPGQDSRQVDINGFFINEYGDPWFCGPNGILDQAELIIVQDVLNSASTVDFSEHGGVSHTTALAHWLMLLDTVHAMSIPSASLSEEQEAALERVIAGYIMLGDPASLLAGVYFGLAAGWGMVDTGMSVNELCGTMPGPFSVAGDFTGPMCCETGAPCNPARFSNFAKWVLSMVTEMIYHKTEEPPVDDVFEVYRGLLNGDTCDQKDMLAGIANSDNDFDDVHFGDAHFHSVTVETVGQFLNPLASRTDHIAGEPVTLIALPDYPWAFDHWEVSSGEGETYASYTVYDPVLEIAALNVDTTVRAVGVKDLTAAITFEDRQLEQAVRAAANKLNPNDALLWGDVDGLTMLEARGLGIASLDGLQYLTSLIYLDLRDNHISYLGPLGALTNIETLYLGHNYLDQSFDPYKSHPLAPLAGMAHLEFLDLGRGREFYTGDTWSSLGSANHLRNVAPLESINTLQTLDLCGNNLDSLEGLDGKISMQFLMLDDNCDLLDADLNPNCAQNISTLSSMVNLRGLYAQNTGLTETTLQALLVDGTNPRFPALAYIALSGNPDIETLNALETYEVLEAVLCGDNPGLTSIEKLAGKGTLKAVQLANTAVMELATLGGGNLQDGRLIALNNPGLVGARLDPSTCPELRDIESHANEVIRDFACEGEVSVIVAVSPEDAGSVMPFVGTQAVMPGTVGILEAVQTKPDYVFSHWEGPVADGSRPVTPVYVDHNMALTAVFTQYGPRTLIMLEPDGGGTVTPAPGNWASREKESRVITATPAPGWVFGGWQLDGVSTSTLSPWTVTMNSSHIVKALFAPADVKLNVGVYGTGTGTASPACGDHYYTWGTTVWLQATPDGDSCFTAWGGTATILMPPAVPNPCVTLDQTTYANTVPTIAVGFDLCDKTAFTIATDGFGTTTPEPETYHYTPGTAVVLSASPYPGWRFDHWVEDEQPDQARNPHTVTIGQQTEPRIVTAKFVEHNVLDDFQAWLNAMYPDPENRPAIGSYHLGEDLYMDRHDRTAAGHDMPDLLRFAMLEECLTSRNHPLHAEVMQKYWVNVARWYHYAAQITDADTTSGHYVFPTATELHTLAAYSTFASEFVLPYNDTIEEVALYMFKIAHDIPLAFPVTWDLGLNNVMGLGLEGDFDGDGFSNVDEWLYALCKNPALAGNFEELVTLPNLHASPLSAAWQQSVECAFHYIDASSSVPNFSDLVGYVLPPFVNVTIIKEGEGTVYPSGILWLPKYRLDDWPPGSSQTNCPDCVEQTIVARAIADNPDWSFKGWQGRAQQTCESALQVPLRDYTVLRATFVERDGLADLNIFEDYVAMMRDLGAEAMLWSNDSNGIAYRDRYDYTTSNWVVDEVEAGNGISDISEICLLNEALHATGLQYSDGSGFSNQELWDAWSQNLALAQSEMCDAEGYAQNIVAALMTLGDYGSVQLARRIAELTNEEHAVGSGYIRTQARYLAPEKDLNGDGVANKAHWSQVSAITASWDRARAFAGTVLGVSIQDESAMSQQGGAEPEQGQGTTNQQTSQGTDLDECSDLCPMDMATLTDASEAVSQFYPTCSYSMSPSAGQYRKGREVRVDADPGPLFRFDYWGIPNSLADGSREPSETFALMDDTTPLPIFATSTLELPFDNEDFSIYVTGMNGATEVQERDENDILHRYVKGPEGSAATCSVAVHSRPPDSPRYFVRWALKSGPNGIDPVYDYGESTSTLLAGYLTPEIVSVRPTTDKFCHFSAGYNEGGVVMVSGYAAPTNGGVESWHGCNLFSVTVPDPNRNNPPDGCPVSMTVQAHDGYVIDSVDTSGIQPLYVNSYPYEGADHVFFGFAAPASDTHGIKVTFKKKREYTLDLKVKQTLSSANSAKCNAYVTATPAKKYYSEGDRVTLRAYSNSVALKFKEWKGDVDIAEAGSDPTFWTMTIVMGGYDTSPNKEITAVFSDEWVSQERSWTDVKEHVLGPTISALLSGFLDLLGTKTNVSNCFPLSILEETFKTAGQWMFEHAWGEGWPDRNYGGSGDVSFAFGALDYSGNLSLEGPRLSACCLGLIEKYNPKLTLNANLHCTTPYSIPQFRHKVPLIGYIEAKFGLYATGTASLTADADYVLESACPVCEQMTREGLELRATIGLSAELIAKAGHWDIANSSLSGDLGLAIERNMYTSTPPACEPAFCTSVSFVPPKLSLTLSGAGVTYEIENILSLIQGFPKEPIQLLSSCEDE